jgi:hypothetical protein
MPQYFSTLVDPSKYRFQFRANEIEQSSQWFQILGSQEHYVVPPRNKLGVKVGKDQAGYHFSISGLPSTSFNLATASDAG